ncbi:hypothetical protein ACFLSJ_01870 [Verrucomicrobiota bacterium]
MVFYVYMQPEVVTEAKEGGPYAVQALIAILRGFLQNCCIAEFDDYRDSLKTAVNALPEDFNRTELKTVLSKLARLHRFIYCLEADYMSGQPWTDQALQQSRACLIDLLLLEAAAQDRRPDGDAEVCGLATYQNTEFERNRFEVASDGKTFSPGEYGETDFLDIVFLKILRNARGDIVVYDCILGEKFGDNFEHTMKEFFRWIERILPDPNECSLAIHCGTPKKATPAHIKGQLASWRTGRVANMRVQIHYYKAVDGKSLMPHQRFILTDQFAVEVDRGFDFLDRKTHRNRDVSLNTKSHSETSELLASYAGNLHAVHAL